MSDEQKRRAREIASLLVKENHPAIYQELGELVLELIEEPEALTIEETGWDLDYEGMIATDVDGDEVILVGPRKAYDGDEVYHTLWKNRLNRLVTIGQRGVHLRPTGRYAIADRVLKNEEDQE